MSIYSEPQGPTNPPADGPAPGIAAARDKLPNAGFIEVTTPLYEATPPASVPKADRRPEVSPAVATYETTARCDDDGCWNDLWIGEVALATPDLFELIAGRPMNDSEAQAVEAGNALVFGAEFAGEEGPITIGADDYVYEDPYYDNWAKPERVQLETHVVPLDDVYGSLRFVLIPDHALSDGTTSSASQAFLTYGDAEAEDVSAALAAAELQGAYAHIEEGPDTYAGIIAIILAAASAFVTLVGVAIAVSLASAESRPDYATLGAVGAPPRRRRLVAGAQALVVAVTGTALGLALGSYIAFTAWPTTGSPDFVVPWSNLALTGVAVPVLAVVIAMIFTPSRLPMMRRLD
jgi:putative ABC transport system permease protein